MMRQIRKKFCFAIKFFATLFNIPRNPLWFTVLYLQQNIYVTFKWILYKPVPFKHFFIQHSPFDQFTKKHVDSNREYLWWNISKGHFGANHFPVLSPQIWFLVVGGIPHICHESHENSRVNFFGWCKFLQIQRKKLAIYCVFCHNNAKMAIYCVFCRNLRVFSV